MRHGGTGDNTTQLHDVVNVNKHGFFPRLCIYYVYRLMFRLIYNQYVEYVGSKLPDCFISEITLVSRSFR